MTVAGYLRDGQPVAMIVSMILVWLCVCAAVVGIVQLRGWRPRRATFIR